MNLITKDGEYLLRLTPLDGGMRPQFFIQIAGDWGRPAIGPVLKKGDDVHITAVWTGEAIHLFTNGLHTGQGRSGQTTPSDSPLIIAKASRWAPHPLNGKITLQRLLPQALSLADILRDELNIAQPQKDSSSQLSDFTHWHITGGIRAKTSQGLQAKATAPIMQMICTGLDVDITNKHELGLLISSKARQAQIAFFTTGGVRILELDLPAYGSTGTVLVNMRDIPEWAGRLQAIALLLDDRDHTTVLQDIRVEEKPTLPPWLSLELVDTSPVLPRCGNPFTIRLRLHNAGGAAIKLQVTVVSSAFRCLSEPSHQLPALDARAQSIMQWSIKPLKNGHMSLAFRLECAGVPSKEVQIPLYILEEQRHAELLPPKSVDTKPISVGMMVCPLWRQGSRGDRSGWYEITPYPQRQPALGWYDEGDTAVTDWEIRWAVEHGVEFFTCCWYRDKQNIGKPVVPWLNHWVESLQKAPYGHLVKYSLLWENLGCPGVSNADDMLQNLLPYWIANHFTHPYYLTREGKPVLHVYGVQKMVDELGGEAGARRTIALMREGCKKAGLNGLILMGANHTSPSNDNSLAARVGFDAMWAYHWPTASDVMPAVYTPQSIMKLQQRCWQMQDKSVLPHSNTVCMGWDASPWGQTKAFCFRIGLWADRTPGPHPMPWRRRSVKWVPMT